MLQKLLKKLIDSKGRNMIMLEQLRNELRQLQTFQIANSSKTINHVLMMWMGVLGMLGMLGTLGLSKDVDIKAFFIYYSMIVSSVLLISNLILFFAVKRDHEIVNSICKLASYVLVFFERKLLKNRNDNKYWKYNKDDYIFWEILHVEKDAKTGKEWRILRYEYTIISSISTIFILIISSIYFAYGHYADNRYCLFYFAASCASIILTIIILINASMQYHTKKIKWLRYFLDYAIENNYYTKDDILDKFGDEFLKTIRYPI
jgi:hypothetical protein